MSHNRCSLCIMIGQQPEKVIVQGRVEEQRCCGMRLVNQVEK